MVTRRNFRYYGYSTRRPNTPFAPGGLKETVVIFGVQPYKYGCCCCTTAAYGNLYKRVKFPSVIYSKFEYGKLIPRARKKRRLIIKRTLGGDGEGNLARRPRVFIAALSDGEYSRTAAVRVPADRLRRNRAHAKMAARPTDGRNLIWRPPTNCRYLVRRGVCISGYASLSSLLLRYR